MSALTMSRRIRATQPVVTLVTLPSLGTTAHVWDPLLERLRTPVDVLSFDLPGHGGAGPAHRVDIVELARSVAAAIDEHASPIPVVAVGVSMGGALAVEIAAISARVTAAVSFNSGLRFGSATGWSSIMADARHAGTAAFDPAGTRAGWFTDAFARGVGAASAASALADLDDVDLESYIACCRALIDYNGKATAASLAIPVLAVGGRADRATPAEGMRDLAATNPRFAYAELSGAHLAIVEDAGEAAALVDEVVREAAASTDSGTRP